MAGPAVAPASTAAEVHLLVANLTSRTALIELAAFVGCLLLAWALVRLLRGPLAPRENSVWFGQRIVDGVMFPLLALLLALFTRWLLQGQVPTAVFKLVVPILMSLAAIRLTVRVLHQAFPTSPVVRLFERTFSWVAWIAVVLWVTGILPLLLAELDQITWKLGGTTISVRNLLEGAISAVVVLMVTLWLSSLLEQRLLRGAVENLSMRKMAANALRALLLFMGLLFALSAAGIDLTALGVLGGALGVGIGFGLQKLASNYVSGFVILAENSMRIGDLVRVDNFEGRITDITTRYTKIRALNGRESLVPNEMMITQRIENVTLADSHVLLTTVVQVAYGTDVTRLMAELLEVVKTVPRVLADPPPAANLTAFAPDGLELTFGFWIGDPENGQLNARSGVNLALLAALNERGVEIPFPQRVLHQAQPAAEGR
ncbi:MAG: mechanosensitive ion channel [Ideonella sp. WA131b]|jgi:small-conductance mechanosensitive channel|nr:mechanosensitive ion channel [Ideonella sp. WA131b]